METYLNAFVANFTPGKPRRTTLEGREFIVANLSLIVPGVLSGSKGALYYPEEEIKRDPGIWNRIPIVVYHPVRNGMHVSAKFPGVIEEQGIGFLLNARFINGKLRAEGWFDVGLTSNYDQRLEKEGRPTILPRLQRGEPIELSTGLFTQNEDRPGVTPKGRPYDAIARNYKSDHLAVLPDQTGACSLTDGCGVHVTNSNPEGINQYSGGRVGDKVKDPDTDQVGTVVKISSSGIHHVAFDNGDPDFPTLYSQSDLKAGMLLKHPVANEARMNRRFWQRIGEMIGLAANQGRHQETGQFLHHGGKPGTKQTHSAAKKGFIAPAHEGQADSTVVIPEEEDEPEANAAAVHDKLGRFAKSAGSAAASSTTGTAIITPTKMSSDPKEASSDAAMASKSAYRKDYVYDEHRSNKQEAVRKHSQAAEDAAKSGDHEKAIVEHRATAEIHEKEAEALGKEGKPFAKSASLQKSIAQYHRNAAAQHRAESIKADIKSKVDNALAELQETENAKTKGPGLKHWDDALDRVHDAAEESLKTAAAAKDCETTENSLNQGEVMSVKAMDRKTMVSTLVANCSCPKERAAIENMAGSVSDDTLKKFLTANAFGGGPPPQAAAGGGKPAPQQAGGQEDDPENEQHPNPAIAKKPVPGAAAVPAPAVAANAKPKTAMEWLIQNNAPPEIVQGFSFTQQVVNTEKAKVVQRMVGNIADEKERTEVANSLMKKELGELQYLAKLIPAPQPQVANRFANAFAPQTPVMAPGFNFFPTPATPTTNTMDDDLILNDAEPVDWQALSKELAGR